MAEAGRPQIPIDWKAAEQLMTSGCPGTEVAAYLGIHPDTLYDRVKAEKGVNYSDYSSNFKQKGHALIRDKQFAKALGKSKDGDNTLLIWLGKNMLGQKETSQDLNVDKETVTQFNALMKQLEICQSSKSDLKMDESSNNKDSKS